MKILRRLALTGVCATALIAEVPAASSFHLECGAVITTNTVLHNPLGPCAGDGLVIGADNITVDLNGFTLSGLAQASQGVGVRLAGHDGVTVTNGSIRDFQAGVSIENGASNVVSKLSVVDNSGGDGIVISGATSDDNHVVENFLSRNGPFDGIGVFGGASADKITGTVISSNVVEDSNLSGMTGGIRLENWTWDTTVSNNTVRRSALEGIATFADTQNTTITGNVVEDNGYGTAINKPPRSGDGIRAFARSSNHLIQGNTVTGNAGNGIFLSGPVTLNTGVQPGASSSEVFRNTATGNDGLPTKIIVDLAGFHFEGRAEKRVTVVGQTQYVSLPATQVAYDLHDGNANCDNNTWSSNTYGTRNPPSCVR